MSKWCQQQDKTPLDWGVIQDTLAKFVASLDAGIKRILLIPPDYTRKHSGAGKITAILYKLLAGREVDVLPALGTHEAMTETEMLDMFEGAIPLDRFYVHNWREDTVKIGIVPSEFVREVSGGILDFPIEVMLNKKLVSGEYDLIISIGQVLPHEVVGMANYNKNVFVGCGGVDMINKSHYLGAAYGMERLLGKDHSPVRKVYDYAQEHFLKGAPIVYVLNVNSTQINAETGLTDTYGLFIGTGRDVFEAAVALSQQKNINIMEKALPKVVVYLDQDEFKTTWLGCKAIYRTRMAVADGGELVIIAPGLRRFGEDMVIDGLIRKYGYAGRENILKWTRENQDLQDNMSAAAHLIHGSVDGRFKVTVACSQLTQAEIEGVNFNYMPLEEALAKYPISQWDPGFVQLADEEVYYISNPATGLWIAKENWI